MIIKTEKVKVYHGIQAIEPIHKPVVTVGTGCTPDTRK